MTSHVGDLFSNIKCRGEDLRPIVVREVHGTTSGELPAAIVALVDNPAYLPRHRRLKREHGERVLLKLAEIASTKRLPSRWYAKVTSLANWTNTLRFVTKLLDASRRAHEVIDRLGADPTWHLWYTKQIWAHSEAQIAGFVERAMSAKSPPRLFCYLVGAGS